MVAEAFVIYRYADFPPAAVAVAAGWYGLNDLVDYFVPVVGTPHHTLVPPQRLLDGRYTHPSPAHETAALGAVTLTVIAVVLALATHRALRRRGALDGDGGTADGGRRTGGR